MLLFLYKGRLCGQCVVREGGDPDGPIVAGCGIIENDFHDRPALAPNLCALFVEEQRRRRGLARRLLGYARRQAADMGFDRLCLVVDHVGLYERCGWEYVGDAHEEDGGLIRMYGADVLDGGR